MVVRRILFISLFLMFLRSVSAQGIFHTSLCYDLLSTVDKFEDTQDLNGFFTESGLVNDSMFMVCAANIHKKVRASNLCNLYSIACMDKDDIQQCLDFFREVDVDTLPDEYKGGWLSRFEDIRGELKYYLKSLQKAGYEDYWKEKIKPGLLNHIINYKISYELLDSIHREIDALAGPEPLGDQYPKTYVLDIDNAFNLLDETFCTTYRLLDKSVAKRFRIDFVQVYIHENLHRLHLSQKIMQRLDTLMNSDSFYKENEERARSMGEGRNEAFIVAAESFVSHKLGLKTLDDVYKEFTTYCEGTHVLAPLVYVHLKDKREDETFDTFINRLLDEKKIAAGEIHVQYERTMEILRTGSE